MQANPSSDAELLSAAIQARDLSNYLISQPFDFTALRPLAEAAENIRAYARKHRHRELWRLGERLISAAQMDLSVPAGVAELDSTVTRIMSIAEAFSDLRLSGNDAVNEQAPFIPNDPFSSMGGTRWVTL